MSKAQILSAIFNNPSGRTVIIPLDDSSISGPELGLRDMDQALKQAVDGGADAILGFYGLFKRYPNVLKRTPGILNITLSTEGPYHLQKVLVGTVEQAKRLNLGVSVHLNTTAPNEPKMLSILGSTAAICDELDVPLLAHVYPRTITDGKEDHYDKLKSQDPAAYARLVRHGARIAADLGADIIKAPFTGDEASFRTVVDSTYGLPVLMAGGQKVSVRSILTNARAATQAGAKGVAVGRNFFQRDKSKQVVQALRVIVHEGASIEQAMAKAKIFSNDD